MHSHAAKLDERVLKACGKRPHRKQVFKPFVSETTAIQLRQARGLSASLRGLDGACRRQFLRVFFHSWSCQLPEARASDRRLRRCLLARARNLLALRHLRKHIHKALKADKRSYLCRLSDQFAGAATEKAQHALFRAISALRTTPSKGRSKPWGSLQLLQDEEGHTAADFACRQRILRDTFAKQEGGWQCSPQEYCDQEDTLLPPEEARYSLTDLPTLLQVEQAVHSMSDGKAPGPSGIGPAPWKAHTALAARALLPMCLKSHVRLCEPVQNRGTIVVGLFKMVGAVSNPKNHRSIALLNPSAKICHKVVRPALVAALDHLATPLQQGCQPGSFSVALHHFVATKARIAQARKHCWAVLFLDLTAAYYRLVRETLHGELTDAKIAAVLSRLNIPPAALDEVREYVSGTTILKQASPHLRRMVAAITQHTFFLMEACMS